MGISFETGMNLLILLSIGIYHVLTHYFQQKKAINVHSDVYTIEDRLKEWSRLTLLTIQHMEILEKKIQIAVKSAIINSNLPPEICDNILASIVSDSNKVAEEIYKSLERKEPKETKAEYENLAQESAKNVLRSLLKNHTSQ
jgi:hypothetical protein